MKNVSKQNQNNENVNLEKPQLRFSEFKENWNLIKLEDNAIIKGRIGWKNLKSEEYTEEGPSLIAGKHINNGIINWDECDHITIERYNESPEIALQNGDIIFSKDGSLGNPALIKNLNQKATINGTMMLVRLNNLINPNYFYQVLNSDYFFRLLHILKSGSSIPHIFQRDMINFKFPICSFEEQKKIAYFLEIIDKKIELLEKTLVLYQKLEEKIRRDIFNFKENCIDFERYTLEDIAHIKKGFTPSTQNEKYWENGEYKWLSIADMGKKYLTESSKKITAEAIKYKDIIPKNTLIMSFKLSIGKLAILKEPMFTNEAIANFTWKTKDISTEYMYYYLKTINILKYGSQAAKGVTLNNDSLNSIPILLPSYEDQNEIVKLLKVFEMKIELIKLKLEKEKEFKKGILQKMFV